MKPVTRRRIWSSASLLLFLGILVLLTVLFGDKLVELVRDPDAFEARMDSLGFGGYAVFVGLMAVQVILAVIPGQPFEFVGGYCFGLGRGTLLVMIGASLGSAVAFFLARIWGLKAVTAFYSEEKLQKVSFLRESSKQKLLTFIAFLIPGIPKDMLAYVMGLTRMRFTTFLILSSVGRLPGVLLSVLGGTAIQLRSPLLIAVSVVLILVLLIVGFFYYRKHTAAKDTANFPADGNIPPDGIENPGNTPEPDAEFSEPVDAAQSMPKPPDDKNSA